ncbi:hypothetical protein HYX11_04485 [Candidatus Woesearchaeota archaeon]|nr:hypothetical protein [Candidatus Woesearchaeota archaeon]
MAKIRKGAIILKQSTEEAIKNVAAEYLSAKDLQLKLQKIDREESDQAISDARKGLHIIRYLIRSEKSSYEFEKNILKELQSLKEAIPPFLQREEERLLQQLSIAEGKLVRVASNFGDLQKEINQIAANEQLLKRIKNSVQLRSQLGILCKQAKAGVDQLLTWIAATEEILRQTKEFSKKLEQISSPED